MVLTDGKKPASRISSLEINSDSIFINDLQILGKDIANYLQQIPESERVHVVERSAC